jgi:hypothetical protein
LLKCLGAFIRLTPKCHPEIAGRGIEHAWGHAKLRFRRGVNHAVADHLENNVKAALSCEVLTINKFRKFAQMHEITSSLALILLHWLMGRMPLQLRVALNTSQSCLNSIVQHWMPIISSLLMLKLIVLSLLLLLLLLL